MGIERLCYVAFIFWNCKKNKALKQMEKKLHWEYFLRDDDLEGTK